MSVMRLAAIAGAFYPEDRQALSDMVGKYLLTANDLRLKTHIPTGQTAPKALIVPHAGYVYSGTAAARAYVEWAPVRTRINRVVLIGPAHRVAFKGIATTRADYWSTPLGPVAIDRETLKPLVDTGDVLIHDQAHDHEHCLEIHLPFLQRLIPSFQILPFLAGQSDGQQVARLLEKVWGGPETAILISSDLSHYLSYEAARALDEKTAKNIEAFKAENIEREHACGRIPISGLLACAKHRDMTIQRLALLNSGDTCGPKDRVVGYGAWRFDYSSEHTN